MHTTKYQMSVSNLISLKNLDIKRVDLYWPHYVLGAHLQINKFYNRCLFRTLKQLWARRGFLENSMKAMKSWNRMSNKLVRWTNTNSELNQLIICTDKTTGKQEVIWIPSLQGARQNLYHLCKKNSDCSKNDPKPHKFHKAGRSP